MAEEVTENIIKSENATKAKPKSSGGLWIGIIVMLTVVLLAGAGFYFLQQLRTQSDDINKEDQLNSQNAAQIADFQSKLATLQAQLSTTTSTISNEDERFNQKLIDLSKQHEEKLTATRKELANSISQIQRQLSKTRGDWLIADAEYLLSVAGQRLHLIGDIETTREALEAADQRLRESGDVGAFKVREEIAKELATLRSIPALDLVGMYSKLQSLSSRVDGLTLFLPYEGKPTPKSDEHDKHTASSATSSDILNAALNKMDAYVTLRHTEQPIKAILSAEQAQFIRQQLSIKLEMIKLALVQRNQTLYAASLSDALAWLDKNFNKNAETKRFIAELNQLNQVKLNLQMPDISLSLKMLRDITKLRIETDKAAPVADSESKSEPPKVEEVTTPPSEKMPSHEQTTDSSVKSEAVPPALPAVEKIEKPVENTKAVTAVPVADKPSSKSEPVIKPVEPSLTAPTPVVVKPAVVH